MVLNVSVMPDRLVLKPESANRTCHLTNHLLSEFICLNVTQNYWKTDWWINGKREEENLFFYLDPFVNISKLRLLQEDGQKTQKPQPLLLLMLRKAHRYCLPADDELLIRITTLSAWTIRPVMMV